MSDKPIEVILDTEVLKGDPSRSKGPFRALTRLSKTGNIRIHIPEIAVRDKGVTSTYDSCNSRQIIAVSPG